MNFLGFFGNEIETSISDPNGGKLENAVVLLPLIAPIIFVLMDKFMSLAHDAMEHRYDIKVKVGPVDIFLSKSN